MSLQFVTGHFLLLSFLHRESMYQLLVGIILHLNCHRPSLPLPLLSNQQLSKPLRDQTSHCSKFRIICEDTSIAVICIEFIECFPILCVHFGRLLFLHSLAPIGQRADVSARKLNLIEIYWTLTISKNLLNNFSKSMYFWTIYSPDYSPVVH